MKDFLNFQKPQSFFYKALTPFGEVSSSQKMIISSFWLVLILSVWLINGTNEMHMFPTIPDVWAGFTGLIKEGMVSHLGSSLSLCAKAVLISVSVSLIFAYASSIPMFAWPVKLISKLRYLPLTGISFYITMILDDGRDVQVWILVVFMTTFLITGLLSMMKDIPVEEFDHARTLGYNRWQVLWEVVVKGRFDYVIETIRQNLAIVWMMLVTVESILASAGGLGFLIKNSDKFMNHGRIIALQLLILIVGLLLDLLLTGTRKISFRYSKI